MKIFIYGKNLKLTAAIKNFTDKQIRRKFSKLGKKVQVVRIYLENIARKDNDPYSSSAKCKVEMSGKNLVIRSKAQEIYQAITLVVDAAWRKLRKVKEKRVDKKRNIV